MRTRSGRSVRRLATSGTGCVVERLRSPPLGLKEHGESVADEPSVELAKAPDAELAHEGLDPHAAVNLIVPPCAGCQVGLARAKPGGVEGEVPRVDAHPAP